MKDVTPKPETRREARAQSFLAAPADALELLREGRTEKGDALEIARTAGIMAAKRTWELLPFCHPLPLTHAEVEYEFRDEGVRVTASARTIGPTGVEMEALSAASVAALTLYDMLKPHTTELEVRSVRLVEKRGGKSDHRPVPEPPVRAGVLVSSDGVAAGEREDTSGAAVRRGLEETEGAVAEVHAVVPDEVLEIRRVVKEWVSDGVELVLVVGGTGVYVRDVTPEAVRPLLDREIPGIMEAARSYGQRRVPYSMLSRGLAGTMGDSLVITLPGSTSGATESFRALFPAALHVIEVIRRGSGAHGEDP